MFENFDRPTVLGTRELIDELLKERKKDRRMGLIKACLLAFVTLAYFGWASIMFGGLSAAAPPTGEYVAVVKISGVIGPDKDASYAGLAPQLKQAFEDQNAKGVILLINSPGGTPVQAGLIHDLVVKLKTDTKKTVVAVGEDMLTSGAYMIASAADRIVVHKSTVAGSIGVISAGFGFTNLMEKIGVERRVAAAGDSKNMLDPFSPVNPKDLDKQKLILSEIHSQFKDLVKEDRGSRLKLDTEGLFEGNVWTGASAVTIGLVDETGDIDSALQKHFNTTEFRVYEQRKPLFDSLIKRVGVEAGSFLSNTYADLPMALHRN